MYAASSSSPSPASSSAFLAYKKSFQSKNRKPNGMTASALL
jgi:hypothetical protein